MNSHEFRAPDTPVGERIEQLELDPPRPKEKEWLKQTLATRWPEGPPKPSLGSTRRGRLHAGLAIRQQVPHLSVHPDRKTGTYCPWPSNDTEGSLEDLDLNTGEAWLFLKDDITRPAMH